MTYPSSPILIASSIGFCALSYIWGGRALLYALGAQHLGVGFCGVLGAAILALLAYSFCLLFPSQLFEINLTLMLAAVVCGAASLWYRRPQVKTADLMGCLFLAVACLPLLWGVYGVPLWGDELNMEAPLVRFWFSKGLFETGLQPQIQGLEYPRIWTLMLYQSLLLRGSLQIDAGRWLCILLLWFAGCFIYHEMRHRWGFTWRAALNAALFVIVLTTLSNFAWSLSWYYTSVVSVLLFLAFYQVVLYLNDRVLHRILAASLLLAVVAGIRPDGFIYTPLAAVLCLFTARQPIRRRLGTSFLLIAACLITVLSWQWYTKQHGLYDAKLDPVAMGTHLSDLWHHALPIAWGMIGLLVEEWQQSGSLLVCYCLALLIIALYYKRFPQPDRLLLLLLLLPAYKFVALIAANTLFINQGTIKPRLGRHIMQTAPLVYFVLVFLSLRLTGLDKPLRGKPASVFWKRGLLSSCLALLLCLVVFTGLVFANLPEEINQYVKKLVVVTRQKMPQARRVRFMGQGIFSHKGNAHSVWRFYASAPPSIYTPGYEELRPSDISAQNGGLWRSLRAQGVDGLLVYRADNLLAKATGLALNPYEVYLLSVGPEGFEIRWSEKMPLADPWGAGFRLHALRKLWNSL